MNMEVIRADAGWEEKIIAFADQVFGEDVEPGGFAALIPAVYGEKASCDNNHLLVLEDGKIQALLLTEPTTFVCGARELKGIGVGTVSVAKEARGKGYMKLLLSSVRDWMRQEGYAFAVLSGQRQRYEYWGYEPTGIKWTAFFTPASVKHALCGQRTDGTEELELTAMEEEGTDTRSAYELFCGQTIHTRRSFETFRVWLESGRSRPFIIRRNGVFAGYLSASFRRGCVTVTELELVEESLLYAVLRLFFEKEAPEGFTIQVPFYKKERLALIERVCDRYEVRWDHQYYVADLKRVLAFSMEAKRRTCGLADGSWEFATEEGYYCCQVRNGEVSVTHRPDAPSAVFTATKGEMVRLLFGPSGSMAWDAQDIPAGWLPFPLYLPETDAV